MPELSLFSAFLVGLLGGGHCAGMCGGIVGAVTATLPGQNVRPLFPLAYNAGRITSYTLAGALAGLVGMSSHLLGDLRQAELSLYIVANLMLVGLGLYLADLWHGVLLLEKAGAQLWQHLQPLSRRWLPLRSARQAFLVGLIWGWLPCGLVYSVLIAALASGSLWHGGATMLAFGLGTLPTLLTMGLAATRLKEFLQHPAVRKGCGLLVLGFGVMGLTRLIH